MTQYIAFLRAINIMGRFMKMEALRRIFDSMGFANVATYIQSGNVLFEAQDGSADALERMIEERLQQALRMEVATFVRSKAELIEVAEYRPFSEAEMGAEAIFYIAFVRQEPSGAAQQSLLASSNAIDTLKVYGQQVFWLCRQPGSTTVSSGKLEKLLGGQATVRNVTTVRKLVAKYLK